MASMWRYRRVGVGAALGLAWGGLVAWCWLAAARPLPDATVQLRDRTGAFLGEVGGPADGRLGFWRLRAIPDRVAAATVALEDQRFWSHPGVDGLAVARAARDNLRSGTRVSGASTLAMQVARMQSPGPRTWWRKGTEALTALLLVDRWGHEGVLRRYLTLAPYGNNVHGIDYAARRYFDKPVADLSWAETAVLVSVPQAPGTRNLYRPSGRRNAAHRARWVLDRLLERGVLGRADHAVALDELTGWAPPPRPIRPPAALHPLLALERSAWPDGGLRPTTLDLALQRHVQARAREAVTRWRDRGAGNAAVIVVELPSRAVRAIVGSAGYYDDEQRGAIDYSRTLRSPGSTLKPFVYARALERGILSPATVLADRTRGPDGIGNADDRYLGNLLPRQALANSRNIPAVALARQLGLDDVYGAFADLGLHDGHVPADHYGLGVAIGGMPTTLWDLATAYGALATDGELRPLSLVPQADHRGRLVMRPDVAAWVRHALADPMARLPTFPRLGHSEYPFGVAVKTGTSEDYRDAWAFAFSERWLVGVWVGRADWQPTKGLSGYRAGASLARSVFELVQPWNETYADHGVRPPRDWPEVALCPDSGAIAGPHCPVALQEWVPADSVPHHGCAAHTPGRPELRPDTPPTLTILTPADGTRLVRDPDVPHDHATVRLTATVEPPVDEVVWYVDGAPFAVVAAPYDARWPLVDGAHTFQIGLPHRTERSAPVEVVARSITGDQDR